MKRVNQAYQLKKQRILQALHRECHYRSLISGSIDTFPEPKYWPKTREIADYCGESIYSTRAVLLKLVEEGEVTKLSKKNLNALALRWYIRKYIS